MISNYQYTQGIWQSTPIALGATYSSFVFNNPTPPKLEFLTPNSVELLEIEGMVNLQGNVSPDRSRNECKQFLMNIRLLDFNDQIINFSSGISVTENEVTLVSAAPSNNPRLTSLQPKLKLNGSGIICKSIEVLRVSAEHIAADSADCSIQFLLSCKYRLT